MIKDDLRIHIKTFVIIKSILYIKINIYIYIYKCTNFILVCSLI